MKWTTNYPHVTGWWFVGKRKGKTFRHNIIEVRKCRRRMQWSFIDGLTWNNCNEYPDYFWAGPIECPDYKHLIAPNSTKGM